MHEPLKVLCKLGGWRDTETVLNCYQQPGEQSMRDALEFARRIAGSSPDVIYIDEAISGATTSRRLTASAAGVRSRSRCW